MVTTHLERSRQLHLPFWHLTTFVDRAHRKSYVGAVMLLRARDHLSELHVSGQDRRGAGVMLEFHHHGLRTHLDMADRRGSPSWARPAAATTAGSATSPGSWRPSRRGAAEEPEAAWPAPRRRAARRPRRRRARCS